MSSPTRAARILRSTHLALTLITLMVAALPATAAAAKTCAGKRATIVGTPGNDVLVGKRGGDVIAGLGGNDRISGGPSGNDRICGGRGRDRIRGGRGNDRLYGGRGGDRLSAGAGNDRVDGGAGNDSVRGSSNNDNLAGGAGNDRVFGENGNDRVAGGDGDDYVSGGVGDELPRRGGGVFGNGGTDLVAGGTGGDLVDGGPGPGDVVRGDQGPDTIKGGRGRRDIASFTTASVVSALRGKIRGCRRTRGFALTADLGRGTACEFLTPKKVLREPLSGIEDVAGTSYRDRIRGNRRSNRIDGGPGNDVLRGGGGSGDRAFGGSGYDSCGGFAASFSCPGPASRGKTGAVELARSIDGSRTLVVRGSGRSDRLLVTRARRGFAVVSSRRLRVTGCRATQNGAFCKVKGLSTILINARGGRDRIVIARDVPAGVGVTASGGRGSDLLVGGDGPDHLLGGTGGRDVIKGRGGGDALFGGGGGPDRLFGGAGHDLNTLPATCRGGNRIAGGSGRDNASYALSEHRGVLVMSLRTRTAGFRKRRCGVDRLRAVSSLEGSEGADVLIGNGRRNSLLGHGGRDVFRAGGGNDYVDARDRGRDRDRRISCGGGRDTLLRDRSDPRGHSC